MIGVPTRPKVHVILSGLATSTPGRFIPAAIPSAWLFDAIPSAWLFAAIPTWFSAATPCLRFSRLASGAAPIALVRFARRFTAAAPPILFILVPTSGPIASLVSVVLVAIGVLASLVASILLLIGTRLGVGCGSIL
jgi:hypothetical protein